MRLLVVSLTTIDDPPARPRIEMQQSSHLQHRAPGPAPAPPRIGLSLLRAMEHFILLV